VTVAQEAARGVIITIADKGVGIPPGDIQRVMVPFEQMARTATRATGSDGAGLGLPLARGLVAQHGGVLTLESVPGRGTTATVTFPPERLRTDRPQYPMSAA